MTVDIEAFTLIQTITKELSPRAFEGIQPLYSLRLVLTGPILKKNRRRHPEMDDKYYLLADVCADPDYVCRNKKDTEMAICYKIVAGQWLRATLWLKQRVSAPDVHNSVLSYRFCHTKELEDEIKRGRVVYQRPEGDKKQHPYSAGPPNPCNPCNHKSGG